MDYANKEFKVRFDNDGKPHFEFFDGKPVPYGFDRDLWRQLNEKHERKAFLYIAKGHSAYTGLWKIGVSEDYVRREGAIYAHVHYQLECAKRRIWKIERFFHKRYDQFREIGEYFRLPDGSLMEIENLFTQKIKTEAELLEWIREIDYRQWVKIIQS